jgi:hypothetical protein
MCIHPSYLGLLADRKRKDAQRLMGHRSLHMTGKHKPEGRKWRLLGWW